MVEPVKIHGLREVKARLAFLANADDARKIWRAGVRAGVRVIAEKARANAEKLDDETTGRRIADNAASNLSRLYEKRTGNPKGRVGFMGGASPNMKGERQDKEKGAATPHWRFFEFGSSTVKAQPLLRNAYDTTAGQVLDAFVRAADKRLRGLLKKQAKGMTGP